MSEGEEKLHALVDALNMDKARLEHELQALSQSYSAVVTERDALKYAHYFLDVFSRF